MSRFEFDPITHEPFRQEPTTEYVGQVDSSLDSPGEPEWCASYALGADDTRDQRAPAPVPTGSN